MGEENLDLQTQSLGLGIPSWSNRFSYFFNQEVLDEWMLMILIWISDVKLSMLMSFTLHLRFSKVLFLLLFFVSMARDLCTIRHLWIVCLFWFCFSSADPFPLGRRTTKTWLFFTCEKMKAKGALREFCVVGRKLPTPDEPETPLYRMRIFAPDAVVAKSRYCWSLTCIW